MAAREGAHGAAITASRDMSETLGAMSTDSSEPTGRGGRVGSLGWSASAAQHAGQLLHELLPGALLDLALELPLATPAMSAARRSAYKAWNMVSLLVRTKLG